MDTVYLHGFRPLASIGLLEVEKNNQQRLVIDIDVEIDAIHAVVSSQELSHGIDYAVLRQLILHVIEQQHYELIETLIDTICTEVFAKFPAAQNIALSIAKPDIFDDVAEAGIRVRRARAQ